MLEIISKHISSLKYNITLKKLINLFFCQDLNTKTTEDIKKSDRSTMLWKINKKHSYVYYL